MDRKDKRAMKGVIFIAALVFVVLIICIGESAQATYDIDISARQAEVHAAAELLRSLGVDEDSEAITALSDEWWRCEYHTEAEYIAKTLYGEARGCSETEQAAVVWCILNRVDEGVWGEGITGVITRPGQFAGYNPDHPIWPELYKIAQDVLTQWRHERNGETVERVLPSGYVYFSGNGSYNVFRDRDGNRWVAE